MGRLRGIRIRTGACIAFFYEIHIQIERFITMTARESKEASGIEVNDLAFQHFDASITPVLQNSLQTKIINLATHHS